MNVYRLLKARERPTDRRVDGGRLEGEPREHIRLGNLHVGASRRWRVLFIPMQLEITETEQGFKLKGEVDLATAGDLSELLKSATGSRDPIVLDLSEVSFMDSSGLRALLEGTGLPRDTGPMVILDPSPQVRRLLDISIPGGVPGLEVRPPSG